MNALISTYKEFSDQGDAANAVRALLAAGFDDVETFDLTPNLAEIDDVGTPGARKKWIYLLNGICAGILFGGSLGVILFYVPSALLDSAHVLPITAVGILICSFCGGVIGAQEAWILAKRACVEPTSSDGARNVGIQVRSYSPARVIAAKKILAQYGERPSWLELRAAFKPGI